MMGNKSEERTAGTSPETGSQAGLSQAVTMQDVSAESSILPPSEQAPATRYDLRVFQSLRRIIRAVDLHSRKLSAQHRITGPQLMCLLADFGDRTDRPLTGGGKAGEPPGGGQPGR